MRVVNSLLLINNKILLLFKESRQKWFLPGGKSEFSEDVLTTGVREFVEETGLTLCNASLNAVTTITIIEEDREWLLFTIKATEATGEVLEKSVEGILKWHSIDDINALPMFEGDRFIVKHLIESNDLISSTQIYTPSYELIEIIQNKPMTSSIK